MIEETKPHKIQPPVEEDKQTLTDWEYEISKLRRDFIKFQDGIIDTIEKLKTEIASLRGSMNRNGGLIKGYSVKELLQLKQLGINPKDLIMSNTNIFDGEKTKETH